MAVSQLRAKCFLDRSRKLPDGDRCAAQANKPLPDMRINSMSEPSRSVYNVVIRAAISAAFVAITWAILYYALGVTTVSTILAVLAVGVSSLIL